ncbi:MAG: tetraacyldisaccharide 4'-kinase [Chlamydiales bacterium]
MLRDKLLLFGERWIRRSPWYFAPLSWVYAGIVRMRNQLYDWRLLPVEKVPCTVVSVGNLVVGGTGKTPFVHLLAAAFPHKKVAILSRGYGALPDEAMLLAKRLPNVKVLVGKNRAKLAREAAKEAELLILDDGFQHRRLHRDFDIVLMREKKERYLPSGFLRDSPARLKEADAVFVSEKDFTLVVKRILDLEGNLISSIRGREVVIFSGIANPSRFKKTVLGLGAVIISEKIFADHAVPDLSKLPRSSLFLCTEKDAVKLPPTDLPIYYLEMEVQWISEQGRWTKLVEKIDQNIDNRASL